MRDASAFSCRWVVGLAAVGILACSEDTARKVERMPRADTAESLVPVESLGLRAEDMLRVRTDAARKRLWILGTDDVRVYDSEHKRLIRRLALPAWSVIAHGCMPDMAVDRSGSVVISSNAHPTVWSIDGASFELKEHEIRLRGRDGWAIGFGALVLDADGKLFGMTALGNSLWSIDIESATAQEIEFYNPPKEGCAVTLAHARRIDLE